MVVGCGAGRVGWWCGLGCGDWGNGVVVVVGGECVVGSVVVVGVVVGGWFGHGGRW